MKVWFTRSEINFWKRSQIFLNIVDAQESKFDLSSEFESTKEFLLSFFDILEDKSTFDKQVIQNMRTK